VNFWLKRCNVSSDVVDPSLSEGWAYFVEERKYKAFLCQHLRDEQEVCDLLDPEFTHTVLQKSTCSSHNAINMADTKLSQGLAATGMGTVNCAHHNMKWPNGVGDLQKARSVLFFLCTYSMSHLITHSADISTWTPCFF
jgi:hypothetical protein